MDNLRVEQIEDIKQLSSLNKLKITLASAIAGVAFGFGGASSASAYSPILLSIVPLVCLYIDFQYYHNLGKIFTRAAFLRSEQCCESDYNRPYETFVEHVRSNVSPKLFGFEAKAQVGSSYVISIALPLLAFPMLLFGDSTLPMVQKWSILSVLAVSMVFGNIFIYLTYKQYKESVLALNNHSVTIGQATEDAPTAGTSQSQDAG